MRFAVSRRPSPYAEAVSGQTDPAKSREGSGRRERVQVTRTAIGTDDGPPEPIWSGEPCPICGSHRTLRFGSGPVSCMDEASCLSDKWDRAFLSDGLDAASHKDDD
jgi:hypothetical protein